MNDLALINKELATVDGMAAYLRFVHAQPLLSLEEEQSYARRLRDEGDLDAAKGLILSHLRYVVRVARAYRGYGLPEADLIQEGNIGLMKAVKRFDPDHGVRLVSFAVHWIKAEIQEFILRNWRIVKIATTKAQRKLFFNLRSSRSASGWIGPEEGAALAAELGVSQADVYEMEGRMSGQDLSLDLGNEDEEGRARVWDVEDPSLSSIDQFIDRDWSESQQRGLLQALNQLPPRDRYIIESRWLREEPKTLQSLGDELGVSAERIRQLEKSSMGKLRKLLQPPVSSQ
ncbi:MAG: RNA polymerase sigma factor RpoH [Acidithiobacillus sp.]|nr:RNA polymerase sigma factor RpoH [Acidithiobacillus sp.]